jgi:hypothetical protein
MVQTTHASRVALHADPLAYPGSPAQHAILLLHDCEHRLDGPVCRGEARTVPCARCADQGDPQGLSLNEELHRRGVAEMSGRIPVAAVGSNGSIDVLRAKLAAVNALGPVVPVVPATVSNLGVGHSAHVSSPGYLAAAPYHSPDSTTTVVVAWLDEAQTARLDATEPNYIRRMLAGSAYPVRLTGSGEELPDVAVYESAHGLLADGDGPVSLRRQIDVATWLRSAAVAPWITLDPHAAAHSLAHDCLARTAVRDELLLRGLVVPSNLLAA